MTEQEDRNRALVAEAEREAELACTIGDYQQVLERALARQGHRSTVDQKASDGFSVDISDIWEPGAMWRVGRDGKVIVGVPGSNFIYSGGEGKAQYKRIAIRIHGQPEKTITVRAEGFCDVHLADDGYYAPSAKDVSRIVLHDFDGKEIGKHLTHKVPAHTRVDVNGSLVGIEKDSNKGYFLRQLGSQTKDVKQLGFVPYYKEGSRFTEYGWCVHPLGVMYWRGGTVYLVRYEAPDAPVAVMRLPTDFHGQLQCTNTGAYLLINRTSATESKATIEFRPWLQPTELARPPRWYLPIEFNGQTDMGVDEIEDQVGRVFVDVVLIIAVVVLACFAIAKSIMYLPLAVLSFLALWLWDWQCRKMLWREHEQLRQQPVTVADANAPIVDAELSPMEEADLVRTQLAYECDEARERLVGTASTMGVEKAALERRIHEARVGAVEHRAYAKDLEDQHDPDSVTYVESAEELERLATEAEQQLRDMTEGCQLVEGYLNTCRDRLIRKVGGMNLLRKHCELSSRLEQQLTRTRQSFGDMYRSFHQEAAVLEAGLASWHREQQAQLTGTASMPAQPADLHLRLLLDRLRVEEEAPSRTEQFRIVEADVEECGFDDAAEEYRTA